MSPVAGVGVDAVDIDRFRKVLARRPALAGRVFSEAERADAAGRADPAPHLAARFAAKEAVMKALGTGIGGFALRQVEVVRDRVGGRPAGPPRLRLSEGAAALAAAHGVATWHLSLTHTERVAVAVVVAEAPAPVR